eukprot:gb/GEZJ01000885.1/.p1 GENE.gb/GEZJ01000885.1/~~gb/GEZJ01000885.1/.p1  ORF type:complete len:590 (-),score=74.84 gb/GEZJ01000885.1/:3456-5225(-)
MPRLSFVSSSGLLRDRRCIKSGRKPKYIHNRKGFLTQCNSNSKQPKPPNTWITIPNSRTPIQNMRIVILTDFTSNPFLALRDRVADPLSVVMIALAAAFGAIASWFLKRSDSALDLPTGLDEAGDITTMADTKGSAREVYQLQEDQNINLISLPSRARATTGENAVWLNMSLGTLWRLFRKSTNGIVRDVLQPVLNDMELPDFVQSVKITKLTLGESPCLLRKIQRLPSRALNEIQYKFSLRLVGDEEGRINLDVVVCIPGLNRALTVPICISSLDIEAKVWLGLTVIPYKPWLRFAQWALTGMPTVRMNISVASLIPVTAIPVLSNVLRKILTIDLPQEFLFPKTQLVDLMDDTDSDLSLERSVLEGQGIESSFEDMSDDELCIAFPMLTSLFTTIDVNGDGQLSPEEISNGLIEWGYASQADRRSIINLLDVDSDGVVSLREFISVWGDLKSVFIPKRYRGIVSGVLLRAEGLRVPVLGFTDPYVVISVESQTVTSKRNKATSQSGEDIGSAVWNEVRVGNCTSKNQSQRSFALKFARDLGSRFFEVASLHLHTTPSKVVFLNCNDRRELFTDAEPSSDTGVCRSLA